MKNQATILDVRTAEEFSTGHVEGSINIPLQEIEARIEEIKNLAPPIVCCCAGGTRSGRAVALLNSLGVDCSNGGGWKEVACKC